MNTLPTVEHSKTIDLTETIIYLGSAGVYKATNTNQPHWDPEREYNLKQAVVIPV